MRREITERLGLRDPRQVIRDFDRPEIHLAVHAFHRAEDKRQAVLAAVRDQPGSGLVYAATRKEAEAYAALLGVRAVIAESFERIHRTNLVGMGVLPLQFKAGESVASLGLTGEETFDIQGVSASLNGGLSRLTMRVRLTLVGVTSQIACGA